MDNKKIAIRSESILNQNTVKVYTDGSKLDGRVGAGFYAEYPKQLPKTSILPPWNLQYSVQAEVLAISKVAKNPLLEKMHHQSIARWCMNVVVLLK